MHVDPAPYKIEGEKRQWIMTIKGPMPKWSLLPIDSAASKVNIHKLRGEISLVEQDTGP